MTPTPTPAPAASGDHGAVGQAVAFIVIIAVVVGVRVLRWRNERISVVRGEIERRAEVVRSYPPGSEAHRIYTREAVRFGRELEWLKYFGPILAGVAGIAMLLFLIVTVLPILL